MRKKKILFVINTLGRAGAEVALLSLFSAIDPNQYELSLYVMMAQGSEQAPAAPAEDFTNDTGRNEGCAAIICASEKSIFQYRICLNRGRTPGYDENSSAKIYPKW